MKHLKKRFSLPDNIFKIHLDMIKTAAAAAFYSFDQFPPHIRVQILFHFHFLYQDPTRWDQTHVLTWAYDLQPKKKISRIECCFRPDKMSGDPSLKPLAFSAQP